MDNQLVEITDFSKLKGLDKNQKVKVLCSCGHWRESVVWRLTPAYLEMCKSCRIKDSREKNNSNEKLRKTCEERYGKDFQKNLLKNNLLKKYGIENSSQLPDHKEKCEKTLKEKYGSLDNFYKERKEKGDNTKIKIFGSLNNFEQHQLEKREKTNIEKYGFKSPLQNSNIKEKCLQTLQNNYGSNIANISQTDYWHDKVNEKSVKIYGTSWPCQSNDSRQKNSLANKKNAVERLENTRKTCLEKYGVEYFSQSSLAAKSRRSRYFYDNEYFDSKCELAFWVWCKDTGKNIIRNIKSFEYSDNNIIHFYFPDFEIDGQLYEIKGEQFLKEDGTWQNPFDYNQDTLYEAKHQCAIKNNVNIIYSNNCKKYINYVIKNYSSKFFEIYKQ